ncbi:MAG: endonuclease/exonuclease/phosphatase family protein [Myxococcota bacterium]
MTNTTSFRVVTWNVLADAYVKTDRYPDSPREALDPGHRRPLILSRLAEIDADLIALQEVEPSLHQDLAAQMSGHAAFYAQRQGRPEGSSLFVRRSRFDVRETRTLHYATGDQLALLADLGSLTFVSTHLAWEPRNTPRDAHRGRAQLLELIDGAFLRRSPAILGGDLNALSESVVIQAAEERGYVLSARSQRPWDTANINGRCRKLDYLLIPRDAFLPSPGTLPKLSRATPLPSMTEPSDHLPLVVDYRSA